MFSLSLRLTHPSITPDQVQERLSLHAEVSNTAGLPRQTPKATLLGGSYKLNYCSFLLMDGDSSDLSQCITKSARSMLAHQEFLSDYKKSGGTIEFFVGIFLRGNGGLVLDSGNLAMLSFLGIDVALDIYP
jgi:hypothetical protein